MATELRVCGLEERRGHLGARVPQAAAASRALARSMEKHGRGSVSCRCTVEHVQLWTIEITRYMQYFEVIVAIKQLWYIWSTFYCILCAIHIVYCILYAIHTIYYILYAIYTIYCKLYAATDIQRLSTAVQTDNELSIYCIIHTIYFLGTDF